MNTLDNNTDTPEISEIRRLRKDGEIRKAYELGLRLAAENPDDIGIKRDFAWVCLDCSKEHLSQGEITECRDMIDRIKELSLPSNDIIFKQVFWTLRNILKQYCTAEKDAAKRRSFAVEIFGYAEDIPVPSPDASYSAFAHELHKLLKDFPEDYIRIFSQIGLNFFCNDDYEEYIAEGDNKKKSSRAEIIYTTFAKNLSVLCRDQNRDSVQARQKAAMFIPLLKDVMQEHPEYPGVPPAAARLMMSTGETEQARQLLLKELRKRRSDLKLWQLLAETYRDTDKETALSALCMGLSIYAPEEQKIQLRESAALLMAETGHYPEAKYEIEAADRIRSRRWGKSDPGAVSSALRQEEWFGNCEAIRDNRRFYSRAVQKIEDILYAEDKISIVITYANPDKKFLNFITEEDKKGFFNYSSLLKQTPVQGEIYDVVFETFSENEPSRVRWIRRNMYPSDDCPLFRFIEGRVRIDPKNDFGFVDNVYIPADMVERYHIVHGDMVRIKSIRTFDNIKKSLSWRAISAEVL